MPGALRESEPALTIDDTTAHVTTPPGGADALMAWFQAAGVVCRLRRGGGIAGRDLIDFGNPSPSQEGRIRELFAQWQQRPRGPADP
jgi:hypothetical protein